MFAMVGDLIRGVGRVVVKEALSVPKRAGKRLLRTAGRYSDTAEGLRLAFYGPDEEPTWQAYPAPDTVTEPVTVTPRTAPEIELEPAPEPPPGPELEAMTVAALKTLARSYGLTVPRRIKKADLIAQIQAAG